MNTIRLIEALIIAHPILISFLSPLLSEEAVIFAAVLAGKGLISLPILMIFSFLGIFVHDLVIFLFAKSKFSDRIGKMKMFSGIYKKARSIKLRRKVPLIVFASKFVYGTRAATIVFLGIKKYSLKSYLIYNTLSIIAWSFIMLPLGWLAGRGFTRLLHIAKGIEWFLVAGLITIILFYFGQKIFRLILSKLYKN